MGWMSREIKAQAPSIENINQLSSKASTESSATYTEDVRASQKAYPTLPQANDADLPLIDPSVITQASGLGSLWIVIDGVVYDCTSFAAEHPGGVDILDSFRGTDCSWQFWRFHGEDQLREYGRALRIGKTKGLKNKFKEPPRFVGLRGLSSADEW